jgi:hypothetical protein
MSSRVKKFLLKMEKYGKTFWNPFSHYSYFIRKCIHKCFHKGIHECIKGFMNV